MKIDIALVGQTRHFFAMLQRNERSAYLGGHLLLGEPADVPDCARRSLLELDSLESLVEVQRVVAARWLHLALLYHLN